MTSPLSGSITRGRLLLGAVLCLTVAATFWVSRDGEADGVPRPRSASTPVSNANPRTVEPGAPAADSGMLHLDKLTHRLTADPDKDAFVSRSWVVPPPPPPPVVPSAPPLPFMYIGKMQEGSEGPVTVYLMQGEQAYNVRVGDIIDKTYRVESINSTQMVLMYLPMSTQQTLAFGNT